MSTGGLVAAASTLKVPNVEFSQILPELILLGSALVLLAVVSLTRNRPPRGLYAGWTAATALAAVGASVWLWEDLGSSRGHTAVAGAIAVDGFSVLFLVLVGAALFLTALVGESYLPREGMDGPAFYVLAMLSGSGAMLMAAANDLIVVFLGLEIMSISLYVLAGLNARRIESGEAAMKYLILGAFSSAIFLYGIALVYGSTGTTNIPRIANFLAHNTLTSNGVLLAGLALLLVGFGFKIAAVPFHAWTPDVYQGSPTPVVGFMAAVAKAGGFAGLLRVFFSSFGVLRLDWQPAVWTLAVLTLLLGAMVALVQRDVKRMLAYSSINHAGFVLVGLQAATAAGIEASLYYLFAYTFMVIGSFAVVSVVEGQGEGALNLDAYRGLAGSQPLLAGAFTLLLVAQAGIPFTTGFLAKFTVVSAAVGSRSYVLAVVAMASAAIAAFFYLRLVVVMYSRGPAPVPDAAGLAAPTAITRARAQPIGAAGGVATLATEVLEPVGAPLAGTEAAPRGPIIVPASAAMVIGLCVTFTVLFGLWPSPIIDFAHRATLLF